MTIAIIGGTGAEGSGLALRWARAGESVVIGSRESARADESARRIRENLHGTSAVAISGTENRTACESGDIVVLTVPFEFHAETLKYLKPALHPGQILVDATVPLATSVGGRATRTVGVWQGSAAQQAAELVPEGVAVVAAFHNLPAAMLAQEGAVDCDVIVCSDDPEAARRTRELVRKIPGARALDGGRLENARIVEQVTALLIGFNIRNRAHAGIRITGLPPEAYDG